MTLVSALLLPGCQPRSAGRRRPLHTHQPAVLDVRQVLRRIWRYIRLPPRLRLAHAVSSYQHVCGADYMPEPGSAVALQTATCKQSSQPLNGTSVKAAPAERRLETAAAATRARQLRLAVPAAAATAVHRSAAARSPQKVQFPCQQTHAPDTCSDNQCRTSMHDVSSLVTQHLADSRVCCRRFIWHRSSSANKRRETYGMLRP